MYACCSVNKHVT